MALSVSYDQNAKQWIARQDGRQIGRGSERIEALEGAGAALSDDVAALRREIIRLHERLSATEQDLGEIEPPPT
jgi:hypothetical protein